MAYWTTENSSKTTSTTITPIFDTGDQAVIVTGDGWNNNHGIRGKFHSAFNFHMFSIYLRTGSNNFAQVVEIVDPSVNYFVNFDLLNGTVGSFGSNITTPLMQPTGNGWFRCSFRYNNLFMNIFAIYIVTLNSATRRQVNTLTTSIYSAAAQSEFGSIVTSYIPTGQVPEGYAIPCYITRGADVV